MVFIEYLFENVIQNVITLYFYRYMYEDNLIKMWIVI
jgi:hypothetical protein